MRPSDSSTPDTPEPIEAAAARWLARRDRCMTPAEQDAYLQWLREDARHGLTLRRLEQTWAGLNQLSKWRPAHSPQPNPDLLAPPRRRLWRWSGLLAAAAAVVFAAAHWWPAGASAGQTIIHPGPEKLTLEDGSIVELNTGAKVEVHFTPAERRVQLLRGEAHFSVAKNPARPFIVAADQYTVRAVGTAFSVSLDREAVAVLVTEGKVTVNQSLPTAVDAPRPAPRELSQLVAGQQAVIQNVASHRPVPVTAVAGTAPASATRAPAVVPEIAASAPQVQVRDVTPAEIERALSWQGLRLEFINMPLGDVAREFNRYNRQKMVITDPETAALLVGGNFRADNVDGFVRLLDASFGITAFPHGEEIILRRTH